MTRKSCSQVLKGRGLPVTGRGIAIDGVLEASENGTLDEAFGTGTAAVISPVGLIRYKGVDDTVNGAEMGHITKWLYDTLTGLPTPPAQDKCGWVVKQ